MQLHKVGWGAVGLLLVLLVVGWRGPEQSSLLEDGLSEDAVNVREGALASQLYSAEASEAKV